MSAGNIWIHVGSYQAFVGEKPVALTYQEFELLRLLIAKPNRIIAFDELLNHLWPGHSEEAKPRLGVVICRLRGKLGVSWPYRLQTVRGRGYGLTLLQEPSAEAGEDGRQHA